MTSVIFTVKMAEMALKRLLQNPQKSFFLFGPRATGKTTWLQQQIKPDFTIDLLKPKDFQRFSNSVSLLTEIINANPNFKVIVLDEIQRLPKLLDEVHSLIHENKKLQFILTGSNARKLKKTNANMLAGRALLRNFHTLSYLEVESKFNLDSCLKFGLLPEIYNLKSEDEKKDYLYAYVQTYLKEEIQQEAAVRSLPSYLLFLEHFALRNSCVLNLQNLSGEIGIPRTTINGYLDILEETLIGFKLAPIHLKAKVKEVSLAKFYFFDMGVIRALTQKLDAPLAEDKGSLFETYILHEIKTYSDYFQKRWSINYWGTPSQNEVDFIVSSGNSRIGIEVKISKSWPADYNKGLKVLLNEGKIKSAYGVYTGEDILKKDNITVFPFKIFIKKLFNGELDPG